MDSWHPQTIRGRITTVVCLKTYHYKDVSKMFNQFSHLFLPQTEQESEAAETEEESKAKALGYVTP